MSKFYCNNCEEEVTLKDGKCPNCNTDWNKLLKEAEKVNEMEKKEEHVENDYEDEEFVSLSVSEKVEQIKLEDIYNNINFFLTWGKVLKIICLVIGAVLFILSFALSGEMDEESLFFLIPTAFFILFAFIIDNQLKWKAYMLLTNSRKLKK